MMETKWNPRIRAAGQMACGWCKGFIHEERVSSMRRYVHDEEPLTRHEILPYRVTPEGRPASSFR